MSSNHNNHHKYVIETHDLDIFYGTFKAVTGVNMKVERNKITAIIGPSGCGKSTLPRAFNHMNELYAVHIHSGTGRVRGRGYLRPGGGSGRSPLPHGMVFQKPNPFPKSIYENIAWTAHSRLQGQYESISGKSLRQPHMG